MQLDLSDEETRALLNLLVETTEVDRYPFSPRGCATTGKKTSGQQELVFMPQSRHPDGRPFLGGVQGGRDADRC